MKKLANDIKKLNSLVLVNKSYDVNIEGANLICSILKRIEIAKLPEKSRDKYTEILDRAKYEISKSKNWQKFDDRIRMQSNLYAVLKVAIAEYKKEDGVYGLDDAVEYIRDLINEIGPEFINIETTNRFNYKLW